MFDSQSTWGIAIVAVVSLVACVAVIRQRPVPGRADLRWLVLLVLIGGVAMGWATADRETEYGIIPMWIVLVARAWVFREGRAALVCDLLLIGGGSMLLVQEFI